MNVSEERDGAGAPAGIVGAINTQPTCLSGGAWRRWRGASCCCWRERLRRRSVRGRVRHSGRRGTRTILRGWNDTAHPIAQASLAELFAAEAAKHRDGVAVIFEEATLTYGELDLRANRLAHHLRALGLVLRRWWGFAWALARPDCGASRHPQGGRCVSAARSGLSAGAAGFHAGGRGARVLLTHGATHDVFHRAVAARLAGCMPSIVDLDADGSAIAREPVNAPAVTMDPQHPAYVIYTSGSTGTPRA